MTYKDKVIRKYYDDLVNNLAALDAIQIQKDTKFIEESLQEVISVQHELHRISSQPDASKVLINSTENRMKELIGGVEEKRSQLAQIINRRVEYLKSFPDINELLKEE